MQLLSRKVTQQVDRLPYLGQVRDEMGDRIDSWGPAEQVGIFEFDPGGSVQPALPGHDRVITTPTIYLPYGCPFEPRDRCEIQGALYEVEGHPARWKHRNAGREIADVVKLKRVEG